MYHVHFLRKYYVWEVNFTCQNKWAKRTSGSKSLPFGFFTKHVFSETSFRMLCFMGDQWEIFWAFGGFFYEVLNNPGSYWTLTWTLALGSCLLLLTSVKLEAENIDKQSLLFQTRSTMCPRFNPLIKLNKVCSYQQACGLARTRVCC